MTQSSTTGKIDLQEQRGGFKDEIVSSSANNITDFTIENNSDAEVKMDLGLDDSNVLEDFDLSDLNYNKAIESQNINVDDGEPNVANDSVKVIKIEADSNTLNMINK